MKSWINDLKMQCLISKRVVFQTAGGSTGPHGGRIKTGIGTELQTLQYNGPFEMNTEFHHVKAL